MTELEILNLKIKKELLILSSEYSEERYNILVARPTTFHPKNQIKKTRWLWNIAIHNKKVRPKLTYMLVKLNDKDEVASIYAIPFSTAISRKTAALYDKASRSWLSRYKIR